MRTNIMTEQANKKRNSRANLVARGTIAITHLIEPLLEKCRPNKQIRNAFFCLGHAPSGVAAPAKV